VRPDNEYAQIEESLHVAFQDKPTTFVEILPAVPEDKLCYGYTDYIQSYGMNWYAPRVYVITAAKGKSHWYDMSRIQRASIECEVDWFFAN